MPFITGINPFAGASQVSMDLFESITPVQMAMCVPFIKIIKIDFQTGLPADDTRPLMFDLSQTPQFGANQSDFGVDSETFIERALVSLNSLNVNFQQTYGLEMFREVSLEFTVHKPGIVFDRNSKIAWREILEAGTSFTLEYGWSADPKFVDNPLFNGLSTISEKGVVLKSTQTVFLKIHTYSLRVLQSGEVTVSAKALENGDLALRNAKFSDVFDSAGFAESLVRGPGNYVSDDKTNSDRIKHLLENLKTTRKIGKDDFFELGDILDTVVAPMITSVASRCGYRGPDGTTTSVFGNRIIAPSTPALLLLGNFNKHSPRQSQKWGGKQLAEKSIGDFLVSKKELFDILSKQFSKGRVLTLRNFINQILHIPGTDSAWEARAVGAPPTERPILIMKTDTVKNADGSICFVMFLYDKNTAVSPFGSDPNKNALDVGNQSKSTVFAKLKSLDVPILEFAKAGSFIIDSSFELQPDPLLQGAQVDLAYKDQKDRTQITQMPDVISRDGNGLPRELIIPVSILEGEMTMYGNFVMEVFGAFWVEFFGSDEISGVYHVMGKTDTIEAGKFTSKFKLMSEGIDPLNTRKKRTKAERDAADKLAADTRNPKKKKK